MGEHLTYRLKYGHGEVEFGLPGGTVDGICAPQKVSGAETPEELIRASLRSPIGSLPLRDIASGGRTAAILISARDRVTRSDIFVKILADELNAAGIADESIR